MIVETADDMRALGVQIGQKLNAGDMVVLIGPLGAGKTTLTQGIAQGLGAVGQVTSPTFVISRLHRNPAGVVVLVHVDAYRLQSIADLESLDLDDYLPTAAVVVEWGQRILDTDNPDYTVVTIDRSDDAEALDDSGNRAVTISGRLAHIQS